MLLLILLLLLLLLVFRLIPLLLDRYVLLVLVWVLFVLFWLYWDAMPSLVGGEIGVMEPFRAMPVERNKKQCEKLYLISGI